ncbi:fructose-specific PTS transporter subunit EIIC [Olsenella sp. Marseille-P4559]|uniref:PTS fructose transporter subunit IIABC n=1 Tax=Olsenella sp. Marseille-P4559 TaxID=2364795 RepID=UPI00102F8554|nr:fructose-specific PTS transporter subunit EIIC [Olsenella sp. Marseille-P4559]
MKITDLLRPEAIKVGATATSRDDAIDQLVALQDAAGNITDKVAYKKAIMAREEEFSTAVGDGIAIPHAKTAAVKRPGLAAMTVPGGTDWNSLDGAPADLMFMIAAPEGENNAHLEILAQLSKLLMHQEFADALRAAKTPEEFMAAIDAAEATREEAEAKKAEPVAKAASSLPDILAITACPTGIAHTYMAAESLEKKAAEMGVTIKVETQGSVGAKNVLTAEEVAHAKGVIIAADKNVDRARFGGKQVLSTNVTAGISEPEKLIQTILDGEAPVQEGEVAAASAGAEKDSAWHVIYKHLMNGVSHMLPFVIGGGILTAIAFLVDQPGLGTSTYGSSIPAAAFFKTIGGEAFGLMLPILAGFIAMSIADRPGLAPGFVGGLFAKGGYSLAYLALLNADPDAASAACVSGGFIAALFAGFAAGYMTLGIERLCDRMPASLEGIKPMLIYPLLGTLAIGAVMFVLNPIFGAINTGLNNWLNGMGTTNIVLLGAVVGGMMSIDMGGPFNKAAYVFGTGALAAGTTSGQIIMASVMVGGMVPPLAIALSTTFFKNKWSKADRDAGIVNYIMGLSFITEGAIPFAAADPGHVLPSCIIGSAVAGAISAACGCTSPAPHGGAWVIAVIGNPVMYLVALVVGSVVGALILSFWKKPYAAGA